MNKFRMTVAVGLTSIGAAAQAISVDGSLDASYGTPTAHVTYSAAAPTSNFDLPTPLSNAVNYDIYLKAADGYVFGFIQTNNGGGAPGPVGTFANLYFDLNPTVGDGSDLGFELSPGAQNAFIPGVNGTMAVSGISVVSANASSLEFSIPFAYFTAPIAGLNYYTGQTFEPNVTLRLSQSFGYSVNGGATYGADRLGTVNVSAVTPVPEPETWALMLGGLGVVGAIARRRGAAR